jgi:hypothetical protein
MRRVAVPWQTTIRHQSSYIILLSFPSDDQFAPRIIDLSYADVATQPMRTDSLQDHRDSLLARMCGLYEVKFTSGPHKGVCVAFITMCDVLHNSLGLQMHHVYDLKGSTDGRSVASWRDGDDGSGGGSAASATASVGVKKKEEGDCEGSRIESEELTSLPITLKDMDLRRQLRIGPLRDSMVSQLAADVRFLARLGIMDYSLVVGIHDCDDETRTRCDAHFDDSCSRGPPLASAWSEPRGRLHMFYGWGDACPEKHMSRAASSETSTEAADRADLDVSRPRSVYLLGLVDVLQEWNNSKGTEAFVKSVVLGKDPVGISAVNADAYARRFIATLSARCTES